MEKLALQLDRAAEKKLSVEALEAENAATDGLNGVAAAQRPPQRTILIEVISYPTV